MSIMDKSTNQYVVRRGRALALLGLKHCRIVLTAFIIVYNHSHTKSGLVFISCSVHAHLVLSPKQMISMLDIFMIG